MNTSILLNLISIFLLAVIGIKIHHIEKSLAIKSSHDGTDDHRYKDAVNLLKNREKISIDNLQNELGIGYARAARMIDNLEKDGHIEYGELGEPRKITSK